MSRTEKQNAPARVKRLGLCDAVSGNHLLNKRYSRREGMGPGGSPGLQTQCGAWIKSRVGSTPTPSRHFSFPVVVSRIIPPHHFRFCEKSEPRCEEQPKPSSIPKRGGFETKRTTSFRKEG